MKFSILTLFPEMVECVLQHGVVGQACKAGIFQAEAINPRSFTTNAHSSVDDRPFGGGDGMVMMAEPLQKALLSVLPQAPDHDRHLSKVIYLSPQGRPVDDHLCRSLAKMDHVILICGRYSGMDQRFVDLYVDEEISIGDFVLSGGELPAMALIDGVARQIPGVLGHADSAEFDSFADGRLEHPLFTRPRVFDGLKAPEILFSGHHQRVKDWQCAMGLVATYQKRPDLLAKRPPTDQELKSLDVIDSVVGEEVCGLDRQEWFSIYRELKALTKGDPL